MECVVVFVGYFAVIVPVMILYRWRLVRREISLLSLHRAGQTGTSSSQPSV